MISLALAKTWLERWGPMVFALIGAIIGYKFPVLPGKELFGAFLNALATVGALMASFTGVSISIFLLLDSDVTKALRKHDYYKILMNYAHQSVLWSLLLALAAVVGFVISLEGKNALYYRTTLCGVLSMHSARSTESLRF